MAEIDLLLTDLAYLSLATVLLQLAAFLLVGWRLKQNPEVQLIWLWLLFLFYNCLVLLFSILMLTDVSS